MIAAIKKAIRTFLLVSFYTLGAVGIAACGGGGGGSGSSATATSTEDSGDCVLGASTIGDCKI